MADEAVADVLVTVNGAPLRPEVARDLIDVSVSEQLNDSTTLTLRLDTWDLDKQEVSWADKGPFGLGVEIAIQMGYLGALAPLFVGEITSLHVAFAAGATPVLTVSGHDYRRRLGQPPQTYPYPPQKDSDIATEIIQRNHLTPKVTATKTVRDHVMQRNVSDLQFLQELAKQNNFEVSIDGKTVIFGPPVDKETVVLSPHLNLISLDAEISGAEFYSEVTVRDNDAKTKEPFVATYAPKSFPGQIADVDRLTGKPFVYTDAVAASAADGEELAKSKVSDSLAAMLTLSGRCPGNTALRCGVVADLQGVGKRFSGRYRVRSVTHLFASGQGYSTSFNLQWRAP